MNLLLLFLGSLLLFPYLSQGETVDIEMPDVAVIGKELRIKCSYSNFGKLSEMVLQEDGKEKVRLDYDFDKSRKKGKAVFAISPLESGIAFEVDAGTTAKNGALTFVIGQVKCNDLSRYKCISVGGVASETKTIKVLPEPASLTSNATEEEPVLVPHETFTFTCKGTVNKTGPFDVQWYRGTISNTTELTPLEPPEVIAYNECSRTVESKLSYNVTESDEANLTLWCRIESEHLVELKRNFTVQVPETTPRPTTEATTKPTTTVPPPPPKPQPHAAPPKNSTQSNKTKTLVQALNCLFFFLILFSSFD